MRIYTFELLIIKFIYAVIVGVAVAAPLGPVSILCIRYTTVNGVVAGVVVALGAALGDMLYTVVASFSLARVYVYIESSAQYISGIGGGLLIYLGIKAIRREFVLRKALYREHLIQPSITDPLPLIFFISLATTIVSPMTVALFISLFSYFGLCAEDVVEGIAIVLGVFCGATAWLSGIAIAIHWLSSKDSFKFLLRYISIISSITLIGLGIASIASVWQTRG